MSSIKCPDSEIVLFFCWCLCEMSWQNGCCRNNAFLCLPSQVINVLSSPRDFLPSADSANRRSEKTHTFSSDRGRQSFLGLPFFCDTNVTQMLRDALCRSVFYLDSWLKAHVGCGAGISAPVERQEKQKGDCEHHQIPCWNMTVATGTSFWNQA